jgi:hypothetical protein
MLIISLKPPGATSHTLFKLRRSTALGRTRAGHAFVPSSISSAGDEQEVFPFHDAAEVEAAPQLRKIAVERGDLR